MCDCEKIKKLQAQVKKLSVKNRRTFTKVWVNRLLTYGCVWVTLSYVLAFIGKEQIAEELSGNVVTVIIAAILGYLCKAFFETREEENLKFKREERQHED